MTVKRIPKWGKDLTMAQFSGEIAERINVVKIRKPSHVLLFLSLGQKEKPFKW